MNNKRLLPQLAGLKVPESQIVLDEILADWRPWWNSLDETTQTAFVQELETFFQSLGLTLEEALLRRAHPDDSSLERMRNLAIGLYLLALQAAYQVRVLGQAESTALLVADEPEA